MNYLSFITGREAIPTITKSAAKETVNVIKASTILPKPQITLPKNLNINKAEVIYTSPYASIGNLAEKSAAGQKLNIAM